MNTFTYPHSRQTVISGADISSDGKYVIIGSSDKMSGSASVFGMNSGERVNSFLSPLWEGVHNVSFCPDGKSVLVGSHSYQGLWDFKTGDTLNVLNGYFRDNSFSPDCTSILLGKGDNAELYDIATGELLNSFPVHLGSFFSVDFSSNGKYFLTGGTWDSTAKLWDVESGACLKTFTPHSTELNSVAFTPDSGVIYTRSRDDNTAKLWNVETGNCIKTIPNVRYADFSQYNKSVLTADSTSINLFPNNLAPYLLHLSLLMVIMFLQVQTTILQYFGIYLQDYIRNI